MNLIHSQYKWGSDCYSNIGGFDNHTVIAVDYTAWFHFANEYDAMVNVLTCTGCTLTIDVYSEWIQIKADQKGNAVDIA